VIARTCARAADTEAAGEALATCLRPGDVVLLSGPLGAGKTTFVKGVARGLGVRDRVASPTFTLVREHRAQNDRGVAVVHHADLYRVGSIDEVVDLALGELVEEGAVALVEWGEVAGTLYGAEVLTVEISPLDDDARVIEIGGALARGREAELAAWAAS
jgi:tRNA threonylcarbamoyladenosine biosynthesis protein TsaE